MDKYFLNNRILTELLDDKGAQASNSETANETSENRLLKAIPVCRTQNVNGERETIVLPLNRAGALS